MSTAKSSICQCNKLAGAKTLHPLVSVINLTGKLMVDSANLDCYAVLHCKVPTDKADLGWTPSDFTDSMIVAQAPGVPISNILQTDEPLSGRLLLFHRDLLAFHSLGRHIANYTFFKYRPQEALFLSAHEKGVVNSVLNGIDDELQLGIDPYSATIISDRIELMLDYGLRFYARQFITREELNAPIMEKLNQAIDNYMLSGRVRRSGMPCACRFASALGLSSAYLNDLVTHTSGMGMTDYVQQRRLLLAKQLIISQRYSDSYIALTLGYGSVDTFRQLFKKITGKETVAYR